MDFGEMEFEYDAGKNSWLKQHRGIGFEEVVALMAEGHILDIVGHYNPKRYPDQEICVLDIGGYVHLVPFEMVDEKVVLKTIFPSRKATKEFLRQTKEI